jgi:hypothetical protein
LSIVWFKRDTSCADTADQPGATSTAALKITIRNRVISGLQNNRNTCIPEQSDFRLRVVPLSRIEIRPIVRISFAINCDEEVAGRFKIE